MATTNRVNLTGSGIVSYDGAGAFSALANPLTVANGGTGDASLTAYAVLCGGTSGTGVVQSIASVGSANQALTSNGAGTLPTFQTAPTYRGYVIYFMATTGNPADAATYFFTPGNQYTQFTASGNAITRRYIPFAGTITTVYGSVTVQGTLGSAGNSTLSLRLNNTTDTTITSTLALTGTSNTFNNTGLSIAVVAGDFLELKIVSPTWVTNPTTVAISCTVLIT